ncbi:MAG: adenylate kinase family protein [Thermoplasmata archaeon]
MLVAITGTPGVGKSSACKILEKRGYRVLNLNRIALERGLIQGRDEVRDATIIDTYQMNTLVKSLGSDLMFLDGHISHLLDVDVSIVLRCNPNRLRERLASLGWSDRKISENVEAEAIDYILVESLEMGRKTFEIDTTDEGPEAVARSILSIVDGKVSDFQTGSVDWSEVILGWY